MRFDELGLAEPIVRAVATEGYTLPTPIQKKAIPPVLDGRDVLGCAQTGTGKTAAFALPILHRLARPLVRRGRHPRKGSRDTRPRALVLCPTRELATQIFESFEAYGFGLSLRHAVIFGGVGQSPQVQKLRAGVDVVVATPGRLIDLLGQGCIDLHAIEVLVLDEADRMLDMGFIRDIRRIVDRLPKRRQNLLFSATMPAEIRELADTMLHDPVFVKAAPVSSTAEAVVQSVYRVEKKQKPTLLARLWGREEMERTLVFTRTKHGADKLVKVLRRADIDAAAIHGNKSQGARTRALDGFKTGEIPVLVATDIAARGIDVDEITHVVNYDLPNVPETYVHRIGRTARAGASGIAIAFCSQDERDDLRSIEKLIGQKLEVRPTDPDLAVGPPPDPPASSRGGRNGRSAQGTAPRRGQRRQRPRRNRSRRSAA
jgi:ATP-dependent RNA helicase RhlE